MSNPLYTTWFIPYFLIIVYQLLFNVFDWVYDIHPQPNMLADSVDDFGLAGVYWFLSLGGAATLIVLVRFLFPYCGLQYPIAELSIDRITNDASFIGYFNFLFLAAGGLTFRVLNYPYILFPCFFGILFLYSWFRWAMPVAPNRALIYVPFLFLFTITSTRFLYAALNGSSGWFLAYMLFLGLLVVGYVALGLYRFLTTGYLLLLPSWYWPIPLALFCLDTSYLGTATQALLLAIHVHGAVLVLLRRPAGTQPTNPPQCVRH